MTRIASTQPLLLVFSAISLLGQIKDIHPPIVPIRPMQIDCSRLRAGYNSLLGDAHRANFACMTSNSPKIEIIQSCSGGKETTAYPSCQGYKLQLCELERDGQAAYNSCIAEVRKNEADEAPPNKEREKGLEYASQLKAASVVLHTD